MSEQVTENGKVGEPDEIPNFEHLVEQLKARVSELEAENSSLREQMIQANLLELQQRRLNDSLQTEIESLQQRLAELSGESHD